MSQTPPKATWPPQQPDDDLVYEPQSQASQALLSRRQLWLGVVGLVGLLAGLGLGLLYAWGVDPVIEQNTHPDQLNAVDKQHYVVAIALDYGETGDLTRAYNLLSQVNPGQDPFQIAADTLCQLTQSGQVQTAADVQAMRQLIALTEPQDVDITCDITVYATAAVPTAASPIPTLTPNPTVAPVPTKTPTQGGASPTPITDFGSPTPVTSRSDFIAAARTPFCDPARDGIIQVRVRDQNGVPLPGIEVRVIWNDADGQHEETFFTGLKPELGEGYADFQMTAGETYQVGLVGRSGLSDPLEARQSCGEDGTLSWEVIFQPR